MKLLRASAEPGVIERIKSALDDAGIESVIRNDLAGLSGDIPIAECTPELWVVHDAMLPQAQQILAALESAPSAGGTSWTCPGCGESLEPQFVSCWKCGAVREQDGA